MPDIDLEPHEYRREPVKGESVFTTSGIARLGFLFIELSPDREDAN